jgi:hypothetical protein
MVVNGIGLMHRSAGGLMDRALPADELARIQSILDGYGRDAIQFQRAANAASRQASVRLLPRPDTGDMDSPSGT